MKKGYRRRRREEEENFWPAFTDLISTVALILFFLMLLAYVNNIVAGKNLEFARQQLDETEKRLEESRAEISRSERELRLLNIELEKTMAEVQEGKIQLKLSEEEVERQREIIAASNTELGNLRARLKGIALLRLDVLTKVKTSIEGTLGSKTAEGEDLVSIADNGNIVINEGLLFAFDSTELKPAGRQLLRRLAEAMEDVLDDSETRANIDAINIQGHADIQGTSEYNRDLSTRRATSVVNYMMQANPKLENKYGEYFLAGGFSEFRPIVKGNSEAAYAQNRRIEISVILKDSNIQNVIEDYLAESIKIFEEEQQRQEEKDED